jgi:hypothetical protein
MSLPAAIVINNLADLGICRGIDILPARKLQMMATSLSHSALTRCAAGNEMHGQRNLSVCIGSAADADR